MYKSLVFWRDQNVVGHHPVLTYSRLSPPWGRLNVFAQNEPLLLSQGIVGTLGDHIKLWIMHFAVHLKLTQYLL